MYKQYLGISRDHSGSMSSVRGAALNDYNETIKQIKQASEDNDIDTIVSVIECGVGYPTVNRFAAVNSSVRSLKPLTAYETTGTKTPLFKSVLQLIEQLEANPDASNSEVSFLIMVITDGQDNDSYHGEAAKLSLKIKQLQKTDRWTFTFRVPYGHRRQLAALLNIPVDNIMEWEQTERDMERSTWVTGQSVNSYYGARAMGVGGSSRFYADTSNFTPKEVKKKLDDITSTATFWKVFDEEAIRPFVERKLNRPMQIGTAFYQLIKPEMVQARKVIAIRNKATTEVYAGDNARDMLGIPKGGDIKLYPGNYPQFDVFVQSTSINRKLQKDTDVLYWPGV